MFAKRFVGIIAVYDDEVFWIAARQPDTGRCVLRLPLRQVLEDATAISRIPKAFRGNHKMLCIVPDHWFGMERYLFQSTRPALIESFLERKLAAALPEHALVRDLFNYRTFTDAAGAKGLAAYFLQEEKGYRLYEALRRIDLAPRHITSPGFLWVEKLAHVSTEFQQEGTLLVHMHARGCMLYFYFKGLFIFSRHVALSEAQEHMEALIFEINQSLYMFSQKTKTELKRIYLLAGPSENNRELFVQALGREVIDLHPQLDNNRTLAIQEVPFIESVLQPGDLTCQVPFLSLIHRQAKRELAWEPVQWAGILIGALLLMPLIGENLMLSKMLRKERTDHHTIQQLADRSGAVISEYEYALDRVLEAAQRPSCADTVRRFLSCLPEEVRIRELEVALNPQPALKFSAAVQAEDAARLKTTLNRLVARVKANFTSVQDFSINAIDVVVDPAGEAGKIPEYLIAGNLELT